MPPSNQRCTSHCPIGIDAPQQSIKYFHRYLRSAGDVLQPLACSYIPGDAAQYFNLSGVRSLPYTVLHNLPPYPGLQKVLFSFLLSSPKSNRKDIIHHCLGAARTVIARYCKTTRTPPLQELVALLNDLMHMERMERVAAGETPNFGNLAVLGDV